METGSRFSTPLFSPAQVAVAAFLGGPIAGAWLMRSNYRAANEEEHARRALLWGIIGTLAAIVVSFMLSEDFPSMVLPISYTMALYYFAKQEHGNDVDLQRSAGGASASNWKVVGVGLLWLLVNLVVIIGIAFAVDGSPQEGTRVPLSGPVSRRF
jgi:hypothetical protein